MSELPAAEQVAPPNLSFGAVNEFVHEPDTPYEHLQWLCLSLASALDALPDDDDPVTEDRLRSVGGEAVCPPGPYYHQDEWDVVFPKIGYFLLYICRRPDWPTAKARIGKDQPDLLIGDVAIMGQFRRLCRALGIELSETVLSE